jgi:glyoxylase-like metal-dependent hydrolase (beta-lactamase superfamily II)
MAGKNDQIVRGRRYGGRRSLVGSSPLCLCAQPPGHTDGHCVLYAPSQDALFVGDAVNNIHIFTGQPGGHVAPTAANTSTDQAYESLARIEELSASTMYFDHGDPSTAGPRAIVAEARANR